jgi:hypothetical protein
LFKAHQVFDFTSLPTDFELIAGWFLNKSDFPLCVGEDSLGSTGELMKVILFDQWTFFFTSKVKI